MDPRAVSDREHRTTLRTREWQTKESRMGRETGKELVEMGSRIRIDSRLERRRK